MALFSNDQTNKRECRRATPNKGPSPNDAPRFGNGHEQNYFGQLLRDLRQSVALPPTLFSAIYEGTLSGFYRHFPTESKRAFFWRAHSAYQGLRLSQSIILPPSTDPDAVMRQKDLWNFVVFVAALLHAHHKQQAIPEDRLNVAWESILQHVLPDLAWSWLHPNKAALRSIGDFHRVDPSLHSYGSAIVEGYNMSQKAYQRYQDLKHQTLSDEDKKAIELSDFLRWLAHCDFDSPQSGQSPPLLGTLDTPNGRFLCVPALLALYEQEQRINHPERLRTAFWTWLTDEGIRIERLAMPGQNAQQGVLQQEICAALKKYAETT